MDKNVSHVGQVNFGMSPKKDVYPVVEVEIITRQNNYVNVLPICFGMDKTVSNVSSLDTSIRL